MIFGGAVEHYGPITLTSASTTVAFTATSKAIVVTNMDGVDDLLLSLDGGTNFVPIFPRTYFSVELSRPNVAVRCSTANGAGATGIIYVTNIPAP